MGSQTPKDMKDVVFQHFERRTVGNKVFTIMQLYGMHVKRGAWFQEQLHHLDELSDHLAAIGEVVSDVHVTMYAKW